MGASNAESLLQAYGLEVEEGKLKGTINWDGVDYVIMGVPKEIKGLQKESRPTEPTEKSKP